MQKRFPNTENLLAALPVFEAAARHGSFTRAGDELNLSQPTVSHHIRRIEEHLGTQLFLRSHNRLNLTAIGEQLSASISLGFGHVERELREIAMKPVPEGVTLACSFGFANGWLAPRFSDLRNAVGDTVIHVATTDWLSGYDRDNADLLIVWAGDKKSSHERVALFPEIVSPICSAEFLAKHPALMKSFRPELFFDLPLLHFDERDSQFMNWSKWFARQGLDHELPRNSYAFSNYEFLLQAVMKGEGIGLGWDQLIMEQLNSNELVRIGEPMLGEETAYFLEIRRGRVADELLETIVKWFIKESSHA